MKIVLWSLIAVLALPALLLVAIALGPVILGVLCAVAFGLIIFAIVNAVIGLGVAGHAAGTRLGRRWPHS